MKKYWLVLYPDTFLWLKNDKGILYNSKNYKHFTFSFTDEVEKLCGILIDLDKLYSVELTETLLRNKDVKQWVNRIILIGAGELIEQNGKKRKPISYYPTLTIQNDVNHLLWKHGLNIGGEIIRNLDELIFYFDGSPDGSEQLFRQTIYPLKSNLSLDFDSIEFYMKKCRNGRLNKITFVGDLIHYNDLNKLQKWICSNDYFIHFVLLSVDVGANIEKLKWLFKEKIDISIIVNNYSFRTTQFVSFKEYSDRIKWKFPVTSITQYEFVDSFIQKNELKEYEILPIYNGNNLDFFEEYVFMTKEEFNEINLSKREVFINMTLNVNHFGKLTVLPDKKVYASVNEYPLGDIETPVYDILFKEMTEGHSWLQVRDEEPCSECVYQWLCPSPGGFEKAIGKLNLCHVFPSKKNRGEAVVNE